MLPAVGRVAVGIDNPAHLDALLAATELDVDDAILARYRGLLSERAVTTATH